MVQDLLLSCREIAPVTSTSSLYSLLFTGFVVPILVAGACCWAAVAGIARNQYVRAIMARGLGGCDWS